MSPSLQLEFHVEAGDFEAAGKASNEIKETLKMLGIASDICRRAAIVTYEAEMNLVIHGGGGLLRVLISDEGIEIEALDEGPGIADVSLALQEGYSTASDDIREMGFGAGMGLPNIKRNSDDLEIETALGKGTRLRSRIRFSMTETQGA